MELFVFICAAVFVSASFLCVVIYRRKMLKLIDNLNKMLDLAIEHRFTENSFDESKLSRLEAKMYRLLVEKKLTEKHITEERNRIEMLISDISHQTKTPISNIRLYSELLKEKKSFDKDTESMIENIYLQSEKLDFLVSALVKTSRLENGIINVSCKINDIKKIAEEMCLQYLPAAAEKDIEITVDIDQPVYALFDYKWTFEAVGNILDNAVKYTACGGKVKITAREYEMFACIVISDTGCGISEEELPRVFNRFYRSEHSMQICGVGIGLYLAREIITKQGGYIKVDSKPGRGAVFQIFLTKENIYG